MEKPSDSRDQQQPPLGCGPEANAANITLNISTTTGGTFSVVVEIQASVENLKKTIAKKLKVAKDRICLLHRERELQEGTLKENGLIDGSKIILIPNVETGLLAQRPENTVMQALESLNDSQVNDFLSGKTPLNLSMRLGDHMMLIQLQLSTVNPSSPSHTSRTKNSFKSKISTSPNGATSTVTSSTSSSTVSTENMPSCSRSSRSNSIDIESNSSMTGPSTSSNDGSSATSTPDKHPPTANRQRDVLLTNKEFENLKSIVNSLSNMQHDEEMHFESDSLLEQSPIKSLSNLVSSPIKTTPIKCIPITKYSPSPSSSTTPTASTNGNSSGSNSAICPDPITAKLTSCLCKRLDANSNSNGCDTNCQLRQDRPAATSATSGSVLPRYNVGSATSSTASTSMEMRSLRSSLLHRTTNNPITKSKHRHSSSGSYLRRSKSSDNIRSTADDSSASSVNRITFGSPSDTPPDTPETIIAGVSSTDTRALAEASRNLTQTLRKLSKEVFTNKVDITEESQRKSANGSGAVIESMKNHGKGIYSGTFSGTLNPALQDRYGRPKRDISTVIHILNDLLSATPQYSRGARISFEPTTSRTIKSAQSRRQTPQKELCKCNSITNTPNCTYGECNGHTSFETLRGPFCDKHKPIDDPMIPTSTPTTPTIYTTSGCHCSKKSSANSVSQKNDESSNDSLNTNECQCQFRSFDPTSPEDGLTVVTSTPTSSSSSPPNQVCVKCSSIELENSKTKNKLEQLRLVMQQKKERREARKLRLAPYGGRLMGANTTQSAQSNSVSTIATIASPNDVVSQAAATSAAQQPANHIVEEVDTAA